MANTKDIADRSKRKAKKRTQRKELKKLYDDLSDKEKRAYRRSETVGLRAWVAEQKAE